MRFLALYFLFLGGGGRGDYFRNAESINLKFPALSSCYSNITFYQLTLFLLVVDLLALYEAL